MALYHGSVLRMFTNNTQHVIKGDANAYTNKIL